MRFTRDFRTVLVSHLPDGETFFSCFQIDRRMGSGGGCELFYYHFCSEVAFIFHCVTLETCCLNQLHPHLETINMEKLPCWISSKPLSVLP